MTDQPIERLHPPPPAPGSKGRLYDLSRWGAFGFLIFTLMAMLTLLLARRDGTQIPGDPDGGTVVGDASVCANSTCHNIQSGSTLNLIGGVEFEDVPAEYTPGTKYQMRLVITGNNFSRVYGFQLAAILQDDSPAGTLAPITPGVVLVDFSGTSVLTHSPMPLASGIVDFSWTAPRPGSGPVRFRVAANAANDNSEVSGDHINTKEIVIAAAQSPPSDPSIFYFPQIGVGSADVPNLGIILFSTELIFVNTGVETPLDLEFFQGEGQPFEVIPIVDGIAQDATSQLATELGPGETFRVELRGEAGLQAGYAQVTTSEGVGGTAVFAESRNQKLKYEAGVPATGLLNDFSLAIQSRPGASPFIDTGLALVNPLQAELAGAGDDTAEITLNLYSRGFELLASQQVALESGQHLAQFVSQFFPEIADLAGEAGFEGSLTVRSNVPVAPLTLVQTGVPTLTPFPVIPGRADKQ